VLGKILADKPLTLKDRVAYSKPGGKTVSVRQDDESLERNKGHIMQKKGKKSMTMSHANYSQALTDTSSPEVAIYHYLAISN